MTDAGKSIVSLAVAALLIAAAGSALTGCSPLDDSQRFNPADTASASLLGPDGE